MCVYIQKHVSISDSGCLPAAGAEEVRCVYIVYIYIYVYIHTYTLYMYIYIYTLCI